jgi:SAM-dependent methyltransferase
VRGTATSIIRGALSSAWVEPLARGLDLESAEATAAHARILRGKPFLRQLYERYYAEFSRADLEAPAGLRVEIGSGAGFLDGIVPGVVRVDVRPGAEVDVVASALALPFAPRSVGALFMLNVLHHLPDAEAFFAELERALAPGGRAVMIEPYVSPLSRLVYRFAHHEPFDPDAREWRISGEGAMTAANDALPWIVFCRDRARFEARFPGLRITGVRPHTVVLYALSGGFSHRSLAPGFLFPAIAAAEDLAGGLRGARFFASMMTVELTSGAAPAHRRG